MFFTFSDNVLASDGMISTNEFAITNATFSNASISGDQITLNLTGVMDQSVVEIALNGIEGVSGTPLSGDSDVAIRVLVGDADQSQAVDKPDSLLIRAHANEITDKSNFVLDLNLDGVINKLDSRVVRLNRHHTVP